MRRRIFEIFDPLTTTLFPLQEVSDTTHPNHESVTVHAEADPPKDEAFISLFPDIDHDDQRGIQTNLAEFMQLDASKPGSGGNASSLGNQSSGSMIRDQVRCRAVIRLLYRPSRLILNLAVGPYIQPHYFSGECSPSPRSLGLSLPPIPPTS